MTPTEVQALQLDRAVATGGPRPRVLQLDLLRGVAILLVLGMHSPSPFRGESGVLRPLDAFLHNFGWSGVDLFFVLSGYLIGGILFAEIKRNGSIDVRRFLIRRILRIWPPYYVLLIVAMIREGGAGGLSAGWAKMWPAFVHIQNFIETPRSQLWSLANEEHFYLVLPLFLWLLTRKRSAPSLYMVPLVCAALGVGCLAVRCYFVLVRGLEVRAPMDALFLGVCLAYANAYNPELMPAIARRATLVLPLAALLVVPALIDHGRIRQTIALSGVALAYAAVLVCFVHRPPGRWAQWRATRGLAFVGSHSYSIYLWHRDVSWGAYELALTFGRKWLPSTLTWVLHTSAYVGASIVGGIVLGYLIESPVQQVRQRLFPGRIPT